MTPSESYSGLWNLLRCDLVRHRILLEANPTSGFRLWLGLISPRFVPILLIRLMGFCENNHLRLLARIISLANCVFFGLEVAARCRIGPGLFLPHTHGTVIGAVHIGCNAVIYQGVTLGAKGLDFSYDSQHRPTLGDHVIVGCGAVVLGGISIGNSVIIGANAVVTSSVPDGQTVVGIPARQIPTHTRDKNNDPIE